MKDKMPTLQQNQKSCIPTLKANAICSTFAFAPTHPKPTHHPDKPTNTNLWNMKNILLLSYHSYSLPA